MDDRCEFVTNFTPTECATCCILFAIKSTMLEARKADGNSFYCPNGHSMSFPSGKNLNAWVADAEVLREENTILKRKNVALLSQVDQMEAEHENKEGNG